MENEDRGSFHWLYPLPGLLLVFFLVAMPSRSWGNTLGYYGWEAAWGGGGGGGPLVLLRVAAFTSGFYDDGYVIAGTCFNAS